MRIQTGKHSCFLILGWPIKCREKRKIIGRVRGMKERERERCAFISLSSLSHYHTSMHSTDNLKAALEYLLPKVRLVQQQMKHTITDPSNSSVPSISVWTHAKAWNSRAETFLLMCPLLLFLLTQCRGQKSLHGCLLLVWLSGWDNRKRIAGSWNQFVARFLF